MLWEREWLCLGGALVFICDISWVQKRPASALSNGMLVLSWCLLYTLEGISGVKATLWTDSKGVHGLLFVI